jgi:hypothetical protein
MAAFNATMNCNSAGFSKAAVLDKILKGNLSHLELLQVHLSQLNLALS